MCSSLEVLTETQQSKTCLSKRVKSPRRLALPLGLCFPQGVWSQSQTDRHTHSERERAESESESPVTENNAFCMLPTLSTILALLAMWRYGPPLAPACCPDSVTLPQIGWVSLQIDCVLLLMLLT